MKQRFILLLFTFLAISSAFSAVRRGRSSADYVPEPLAQVLQFIVTGRMDEGGCAGDCSACSGCH